MKKKIIITTLITAALGFAAFKLFAASTNKKYLQTLKGEGNKDVVPPKKTLGGKIIVEPPQIPKPIGGEGWGYGYGYV